MARARQRSIDLPANWIARRHQAPLLDYMFGSGAFPYGGRGMAVWHRRAGKDSCMLNGLAIATQLRVGTYWHLLPTLNQGRKVIWNGIDALGRKMTRQAFPNEIVQRTNDNEMTMHLTNDSVYQVVGSDNYDSLVGSNPVGVVFSEWALALPAAWDFIRPILVENGGFAFFITTPRGRNHAWKLWEMARKDSNWFTSHKTVDDTFREDGVTPIVTREAIEQERAEGVPEEVIQQEYYCSWEGINFGSIFGRQLRKYEHQQVEFEKDFQEALPVYTAWDIGHRDATAIWFYQIANSEIHIIDYVEGVGGDADSWLEHLKTYPYAYGTPALPHDAKAKTFSARYTAYETFVRARLIPYIVPNMPRAHGINAARQIISRCWFNIGNPRVVAGLQKLEEYHYKYDEKTKVFSQEPDHDENSHCGDAFRMLSLSQNVMEMMNTTRGMTTRGRIDTVSSVQSALARRMQLEPLFTERERSLGNRRIK